MQTRGHSSSRGSAAQAPGGLLDNSGRPDTPGRSAAMSTRHPSQPENQPSRIYLKRYELLKVRRPRFRHLLDNLSYIFSEVHSAFIVTFRHFDAHGDGTATLPDFQAVLAGFGFNASISAVTELLQRHCGRGNSGFQAALRGSTYSYVQLLDRLQARGYGTLLNRHLKTQGNETARIRSLLEESTSNQQVSQLSWQQLETGLLAFFHRDYLRLMMTFFEEDPQRTGSIPESRFQLVLSRFLPGRVNSDQIAELMLDLERNRSGDVEYAKFLQMFNFQAGHAPSRRSSVLEESAAENAISSGRSRVPSRADAATQWHPVPEAAATSPSQELIQPAARSASASLTARDRPVGVACQAVFSALSCQFHRADKIFKTELQEGSGRRGFVDLLTFERLLERLNIGLNQMEVHQVWERLLSGNHGNSNHAQGLIKFRELLVRLMATTAKNGNSARPSQVTERPRPSLEHQDSATESAKQPGKITTVPAASIEVPGSNLGPDSGAVLKRCSETVLGYWDELKAGFKALDVRGTGIVPCEYFMKLANDISLPASRQELGLISARFRVNSTARFDYLAFLQHYVASTKTTSRKGSSGHHRSVFVSDVIDGNQFLSDWKLLIQSLRRSDPDRRNHVTRHRLKLSLHQCLGCQISSQDLNLALRELGFDTEVTMINYFKFVEQLLELLARRA